MTDIKRPKLKLPNITSEQAASSDLSVSTSRSDISILATPAADLPSRPYLFYSSISVAKGHSHLRNVVRKQLHDAGFESSSPPAGWEHFGANGDCLLLLTVVPLPDGKTYVQVVATSSTEAPAKHWSNEMANRVKNDTSVSFD